MSGLRLRRPSRWYLLKKNYFRQGCFRRTVLEGGVTAAPSGVCVRAPRPGRSRRDPLADRGVAGLWAGAARRGRSLALGLALSARTFVARQVFGAEGAARPCLGVLVALGPREWQRLSRSGGDSSWRIGSLDFLRAQCLSVWVVLHRNLPGTRIAVVLIVKRNNRVTFTLFSLRHSLYTVKYICM